MNKLKRILLCRGSTVSYVAMTLAIAIIPESCFKTLSIYAECPEAANIVLWRVAICVLIFALFNVVYVCYRKYRRRVSIEGDNYSIQVEYGDILKVADGKVVVNFDECYSVRIGEDPSDIKPDSICGQYLLKYPEVDVQELIRKAGVKPEKAKSQHDARIKYKPGTVVPNGRYLLMAFAKLDRDGLGRLTYDEYVECLDTLWAQIDLYHGTDDVYVPILGSRITRFDKDLTQQQLLDIMVCSYRLSSKKMKRPAKLHIVCRRRGDFSLNDVFGVN